MFFRIARNHSIGILNEHLFKYRWGHGNADQLDRLGRLGPDPYFAIIDEHLDAGGRTLARRASLAANAAHFAEDQLLRVVNHYILDMLPEGLELLNSIELSNLIGSNRVDRARLLAVYTLLHALLRAPRSSAVAGRFFRRWYANLAEKFLNGAEDPLPWLRSRDDSHRPRNAS
jgi:hypothetical protein